MVAGPSEDGPGREGNVATRRAILAGLGAVSGASVAGAAVAQETAVAPQPFFASVLRAVEMLERLGSALPAKDSQALRALAKQSDAAAVQAAERLLAPYTLARISVGDLGLVDAEAGPAKPVLIEQGWRLFLVRVANPTGRQTPLSVVTSRDLPGNMRPGVNTQRPRILDAVVPDAMVRPLWLLGQMTDDARLSGAPLEYHVLQLFSRDHGARRGRIAFGTSLSSKDPVGAVIAWQANRGVNLDFQCLPTSNVALQVRDSDGGGCMAALVIRDREGRVWPPQPMRLAPDMTFHAQIYRADGETVRLPDGVYTVESGRGPEYLKGKQTVTIAGGDRRIAVDLARWIDPSKWGWYSGDTHLHASGCAHYDNPTEGVTPATMIRHVRGEGLSVGEVLTWGPSFTFQKRFFTGQATSPAASLEYPAMQEANNAVFETRATPKDSQSLLRYDLEISGFPSSHMGHVILMRVSEQDYPGTSLPEQWPSWTLPILKWGRSQGAIVGFGHGGIGMIVESTDLPNHEIPLFDGGGTTAAIVDATHDAVDFISAGERSPIAELNVWYHLLNCGFRISLAGETDYPCLGEQRPGTVRSYVKLPSRPTDNAGYEAWVANLKRGRLYCGDGRSHILDFQVAGQSSGDADVALARPGRVEITALVAARLEPEPTPETELIRKQGVSWMEACWHIERGRIDSSRKIKTEVLVNGYPADEVEIIADGVPQRVQFSVPITRSSWVALRIFPSSHSHPVFVQVAGKPVRASRRSAQWCRRCVDKLWEVKGPLIRESERAAAAEAFEHARHTYDAIYRECEED